MGGVVNEPLVFDERTLRYPLAEPATAIRGVTGRFDGTHLQFQLDVDFQFSQGDNALIWRDGGHRPDDETIFYVDYFRRFSDSPLTDINIGSVTRTLNEAIAREIAFVYEQIKAVYLSAFIDTATGRSLDLVVSILGVTRKTKEFAEGLVTFFRDPSAADGNIAIAERYGAHHRQGRSELHHHAAAQPSARPGAHRRSHPATDASRGPAGVVAAGLINSPVVPTTGISRVTNFDPTVLGEKDETDEELRARAKASVRSLGKATLAALRRVIAEQHATLVDVFEPNIAGKTSPLGTVTLFVNIKPGRLPSLRNELEDTRAAGVLTDLVTRCLVRKAAHQGGADCRVAGRRHAEGELDLIVTALNQYFDFLEGRRAGEGRRHAQGHQDRQGGHRRTESRT